MGECVCSRDHGWKNIIFEKLNFRTFRRNFVALVVRISLKRFGNFFRARGAVG